MVITPAEMFLRMGTGIVLGGVIGFEREHSGHAAGLRTHLLVGLASTLFMLVSTQFTFFQRYEKDDLIAVDTSRIAASVVSGIGFLGAGAILRTGLSIQGLTTAASLWLVAALGLASGGGMYLEAGSAAMLSLVALIALRRVEDIRGRMLYRRVEIGLKNGGNAREEILGRLRDIGVIATEINYEHNCATHRAKLLLDAHFAGEVVVRDILSRLESWPGVRWVKVQSIER